MDIMWPFHVMFCHSPSTSIKSKIDVLQEYVHWMSWRDYGIKELEHIYVHVVAPSSLSSLSSTIQCCFHEYAKVRIRMLKMEERLKGVPKWFNASQRHPFIPRLLGIVEKVDIPLIEGIHI
jgi:hypothetical protein